MKAEDLRQMETGRAYEIVKRLVQLNQQGILNKLSESVTVSDKKRGKLHQVFKPSFDWKECRNNKFILQKLNYIHANPCRGKWNLAFSPIEYLHSSAKFYYSGVEGIYPVTGYTSMEDIDLTK